MLISNLKTCHPVACLAYFFPQVQQKALTRKSLIQLLPPIGDKFNTIFLFNSGEIQHM